jgi:hypothetical protein
MNQLFKSEVTVFLKIMALSYINLIREKSPVVITTMTDNQQIILPPK